MTNCIKPNDFKPNDIKPSDHLPYIPILLSEVEQEQRPSGNGDREAIVVGAGLFDGEGERAYIAYAPHYIFAFRTHIRHRGEGIPDVSAQDVSATRWRKTFRQLFVAETSLVPKRLFLKSNFGKMK